MTKADSDELVDPRWNMSWWTWVKKALGLVQLFLCVVCGRQGWLSTAEAHLSGWRVKGVGPKGPEHVCNRCAGS